MKVLGIILLFLLAAVFFVAVIAGALYLLSEKREDTKSAAFRDCYDSLQWLEDWYKRNDSDNPEARLIIRHIFNDLLNLETDGEYESN